MTETKQMIAGESSDRLFHEDDLLVVNTQKNNVELDDYVGRYHLHIVCHKGEAQFSVGDRRFTIGQDDLAIWQKGAAIDDVSQSDDFDADVLLVGRTFLIENNPENIWATKGYVYIKENPVFHLNEMLGNESHLFRREILGKLMQVFLYDLWNIYAREIERQGMASNVRASLFYRFMDLIRQYATDHREITFYADRLCVTPKYLSEVCREESGYPASHWISGYATQEMVAMLKRHDLTLTEISDRMGFYNQAHFSRYAKKMLGMTPSEYRRYLSSM